MQYSTTCIDNFFEDPMEIVKIAGSQSYAPDEMGRWPGVRSEPVGKWNRNLFLYDIATCSVLSSSSDPSLTTITSIFL